MKNLLKTISLLIILAGFFSCKNASIMKRHYNKGYYVSKKHKPSEPRPAGTVTTDHAPALEPAVIESIAKSSGSENSSQNDLQTGRVSNESQASAKPGKKLRNIFKEEAPLSASFTPRNVMQHPFDVRKNLKEAIMQDDAGREALSLLWILILVLLIVYVVGLIFDLFGLGPVFHVLGLIILVLFILWLLRII